MTRIKKGLLLAALTLGLAGCAKHWAPEFKSNLKTKVEATLTEHGVEQYAAPMAACIVDYVEKKVPEQKDMESILSGEVPSLVGPAALKYCACEVVKDPRALELPGYCGK